MGSMPDAGWLTIGMCFRFWRQAWTCRAVFPPEALGEDPSRLFQLFQVIWGWRRSSLLTCLLLAASVQITLLEGHSTTGPESTLTPFS